MSQAESFASLPIIDKYLQNNLLESIGEDENRYQYIADTVNYLCETIKEDPKLLISFSLVAFQPNPLGEESKITLVYDTLKKYWKLIDNVYHDRPIGLIKAIMLETINRVCAIDGRLASIVYHTNASAFPHHKYDLKESPLVREILELAASKAEELAVQYHVPSATDVERKPDFDVEIVIPEEVKVDRTELQDGLFAAVGPVDEQGVPPKKKPPNQYQASQVPHWNRPFSNIASESIAQSIESAIEEALTEFANDASGVISEKLQEVAVYSNNAQKSNLEIETKVLWWMQSLYSLKLRSSYRDLLLSATIVTMAHDLFDLVAVPVPESVVYVLGEAILNATSDIPNKDRKAIDLSKWLAKLQQPEISTAIEPLNIQSSQIDARTQPLIAIVRAVLSGKTASKAMLGDLLDVALTPRQLGMWLFRDLVAEKLAEEFDRE